MQKHIIWGLGGLIIGFVSGGYLAYHSLSKVYKKKLEEAEELYFSGEDEADDDLGDVVWDDPFEENEINPVNTVNEYRRVVKQYKGDDEDSESQHPKDGDENDDFDPDDIYEIDQDRFKKEIEWRDNETLTYYHKDGVLVDCCEHVLRDKKRVIGQEALDTLEAEDISDIDFLYVSNDYENKLYEIVIEHEYAWRDMVSG